MDSTSIQRRLDAIAYPPTHTYVLEGLRPTGVLAGRLEAILQIAPDLFSGKRFLDVGCSKGYFTLRAAQTCDQVVAVEPDRACIELLKEIVPPNVALVLGRFGSRLVSGTFDRIFIGNGPHYLYKDAEGWGWVEQLARLASGYVVLEGPTGMECRDMLPCIPAHLQAGFNREALAAAVEPYFTFGAMLPSPVYTPDRYIFRLDRKL